MSLELQNAQMLKKAIPHNIDIHFKDLTYEVEVPKQKAKKRVLKGISGTFKSGQLTAIMGPSGAGKSSLLNILTGFTKKGVHGQIEFGEVATKSRKLCCYIMQDDHFYSWFSVEETMMFAASLKISNNSMNMKERKLLIEYLLKTLKLSETKSTHCAKLSGGQRKRLSIALEMIDNPSVLFLDEPTTGLDSSTSLDTIELLRTLANENRTIVCTIHQPSSNVYNLFNQIYVMSQGYCTYQGTPQNTVDFLRSVGLDCPPYHNPADFLLECVNGDYGKYTNILMEAAKDTQWLQQDDQENQLDTPFSAVEILQMSETTTTTTTATAATSTPSCKKLSSTPPIMSAKHVYPPPEWIRLWMLIGRCHMQFFRDWTVTYLKLFIHISCAILIGLIYGDSGSNATKQVSNISSLLIHVAYLWFTTMMPAVLRFPLEISIIRKETFNNWYKLRTYYLATLITSTPVHIIFSMVYVTIVYLLTDQPMEIDRFVKFTLTIVNVTICADGFGIMLGTMMDPVNGTFVGSVCTCFMLIYSGFLILLSHMSALMRAISYLSPIRYAFECVVLALYSNNRGDTNCPITERFCYFKNPVSVLRIFGMENAQYGFNLLMILLQLTIYKSLAFFTLRRKIAH